MPVVVFAAKRAWAAAHPDTLAAFRAAMSDGIAFVDSEPDRMRAIATKYLKIPVPVLNTIKTPDLHVEMPAPGIAEWVRIMKGQGLLKRDITPTEVILR
jgi:ABC-type nitrate/sulfonate/bicarbonate transport system substrate-binding protein